MYLRIRYAYQNYIVVMGQDHVDLTTNDILMLYMM